MYILCLVLKIATFNFVTLKDLVKSRKLKIQFI